ncbi:hypothetical protein PC116_g28980 [Phytophthora cactorum]|nr:hypothetical protein PC116_g28980 [Phytophthora cactorum]
MARLTSGINLDSLLVSAVIQVLKEFGTLRDSLGGYMLRYYLDTSMEGITVKASGFHMMALLIRQYVPSTSSGEPTVR